MDKAPEKKGFSDLMSNIQGDKVLWIIVIMLYIVSLLAIFSSTSLAPDVVKGKATRVDIFLEHLLILGLGFVIMFICYKVKTLRIFRYFGMTCFWISLILLVLLTARVDLGPLLKAQYINKAWRTLSIFGFQVHVFEVVKILMVLYLAWAVNAWTTKSFPLMNLLYRKKGWKVLNNEWFLGFVFIFLPIIICSILILRGSVSSMLFITMIMFLTIIIGGFSLKQTSVYLLCTAMMIAGLYGLWKVTDWEWMQVFRFKTAENRIADFFNGDKELSFDEAIEKLGRNTREGQEYIDDHRQEIGSKIAIHEGGIIGKLPGNSTQKYKVPLIFGDYMYSFIVEEYGLVGGVFIMILFLSLLARGVMITKNCDNIFARTAVGGLTLTISGQAMMHIAINVGLLPMTGQTLPMISDGKSSLLMFCFAFGILLSISKMVKKKLESEDKRICNTENSES